MLLLDGADASSTQRPSRARVAFGCNEMAQASPHKLVSVALCLQASLWGRKKYTDKIYNEYDTFNNRTVRYNW